MYPSFLPTMVTIIIISATFNEGISGFAILTSFAAVCTIVGFIIARVNARKKKKEKARKWLNDVVTSARLLSGSMKVTKLNVILDSISRIARDSMDLATNPLKLLDKNDESIDIAETQLDAVLRERGTLMNEVVSSFQNDIQAILRQYRECWSDVYVISQMCEAGGFDDMREIINRFSISESLRRSVNAAFDSHPHFDRGDIIDDIIGLCFVDGEIPDYDERIKRLCDKFVKSILPATDSHLKVSAKHSSPEALYEKAEGCFNGEYLEEAFSWFKRAADKDYPEAQFRLGELFEKGVGCQPDNEKAFYWFERAAQSGLPIAEYRTGLCYEHGVGCEEDLGKAKAYFKRAANSGYLDAMVDLGLYYCNNDDEKKGQRLFRRAADSGSTRAQFELGYLFLKKRDFPESGKWMKQAAENGHLEAMLYYGHHLFMFEGKRDALFNWMAKSAEGGCVKAQMHRGIYYLTSFCCSNRRKEGAYWIEKAANAGDPIAQFELGKLYLNGDMKRRDSELAEMWFNKAIANGLVNAYVGIGMLRWQEYRYTDAFDCFEIASKTGDRNALRMLSLCYAQGIGTKTNKKLAEEYKQAEGDSKDFMPLILADYSSEPIISAYLQLNQIQFW